jgi:hypothetical protein
MRRFGLIATLAAGFGLLGASLHGMTSVDRTLQLAATAPAPHTVPVLEEHHHGCHHRDHRPRV